MQQEDVYDDEEEALPVVPLGDKKLRACLVTGLVKTEDQARGLAVLQRWSLMQPGQRLLTVHARRARLRSFTVRGMTTCGA